MTSGKTKNSEAKFHFNLNDYQGMHQDRNCDGEWQITLTADGKYTLDAIGPISVPLIPLVTCHKCQTSFELAKFRSFIERTVALHLVQSKEALSKKQIRFLRLFFEQTQEEFAKGIGVSDKHDMAKIESEQSDRTLGVDRQVRLRLHCLKLLGQKQVDVDLNSIDDTKHAEIPDNIFPGSESEMYDRISKSA